MVALLLSAACTRNIPDSSTDPTKGADRGTEDTSSTLDWHDCNIGTDTAARCSTLEVPLDWSDPSGASIDLALARIPAHGKRIGSLVTNPGGPGGSGIDFLASQPFSEQVAQRFDLISWDPRGVGRSTAVRCGDSVPEFLRQDPSPDDDTERRSLRQSAQAVDDECAASDAKLLAHMGTDQVVQDLEAIRVALGDEPLNYVGFSYGTDIGLGYAQRYGSEIRSMVLDGVVDPSQGFEEFLMGQAKAFDRAFEQNAAGCRRAGASTCGVADLARSYDEVSSRVERERLPGGPGGIGPAELAVAATYTAYTNDGWRELGPALADALDGDGDALWSLASRYYDFGGFTSYAAVVCVDSPHPEGFADYEAFADRLAAASPRFGASVANEMLVCANWPAEPSSSPAVVTAPDAPPLLVIGNTGDPATPMANAKAVASHIDSATLVVADIDGHTAYGADSCVTDIVDRYLVELTVPPDHTRC